MRNWNIFVTGSDGFVGRYMTAELERRGNRVFTCDLKSGGNLLEVLSKLEYQFDMVVHLAYHVGGRRDIDGLPMNLSANLMLDAVLFNWAVRTKQKRVLYFSSSSAYPVILQGGDPPASLHETAIDYGRALEPDANYGWAKLTGERLAISAIASGLRTYIVRPFSGYAKDQSLSYPFPSIIKRAKERQNPFEIWGSATQVRDWIHITDVVNGALAVVNHDIDHPVNLCTGQATAIGDLALMACQHIGFTPEIKVLENAPMGVKYRVGDPDLMLGLYTPRVSIEQGVADAMRWTTPMKAGES